MSAVHDASASAVTSGRFVRELEGIVLRVARFETHRPTQSGERSRARAFDDFALVEHGAVRAGGPDVTHDDRALASGEPAGEALDAHERGALLAVIRHQVFDDALAVQL